MLAIEQNNHQTVINSSLDVVFNKARISGKINVINIYILNIIFKLLSTTYIELTTSQREYLISLYRQIYFGTKEICKVKNYNPTIYPVIKTFEQADFTDCNNFEDFPKIYYWQNNNLSLIFPEISNLNFFEDKPFDTYSNFQSGKTISYTTIGQINFAIFKSDNADFELKDSLGNIINTQFDKIYNSVFNVTIFVSKNIFSHGEIHFKIIKI